MYKFKCDVQGDFQILTEDLKEFLLQNVRHDVCLLINRQDFILSIETAPFFIRNLENCMEFLLFIRERIKVYEKE